MRLTHTRRRGPVTDPPGCRDNLADQPRTALNHDYLGQRLWTLRACGVEGAQTRGEEIRVPTPVRVMRSDEVPAAAPEIAGLGISHRQNSGHMRPSAASRSRSRQHI